MGGTVWRLPNVSPTDTVRELKERLASLDSRFRWHNVNLMRASYSLRDEETLRSGGVLPDTRLLAVLTDLHAGVLVVGGGVAGRASVQELSSKFPNEDIVLVDPQEYSEHACGIVRAYADPATWDALVVRHEDAFASCSNVKFIRGEVVQLDPGYARVLAEDDRKLRLRYNFCIVATGCSFAPAGVSGESLWQPTCTDAARKTSAWSDYDERFVEHRRRHIIEEHRKLWAAHDSNGLALVVGADYHGVEWACDLKHYFPGLNVTLVDEVPRCLATLPTEAAEYAEKNLLERGIRTVYNVTYNPGDSRYWTTLGLDRKPDLVYVMRGFAPRNAFMPPYTTSFRGPGGGGWIVTNTHLQVCMRKSRDRPGHVWAGGRVFAVGDCHYGAVAQGSLPPFAATDEQVVNGFAIPPVPKTAFAAICWAKAACKNIGLMAEGCPCQEMSWPIEAGIVAVGLAPADGVAVWKVKWTLNSGEVFLTGQRAADMKRHLLLSGDSEKLAKPGAWLYVLQEGIPSSLRFSEQGRFAFGLEHRAW